VSPIGAKFLDREDQGLGPFRMSRHLTLVVDADNDGALYSRHQRRLAGGPPMVLAVVNLCQIGRGGHGVIGATPEGHPSAWAYPFSFNQTNHRPRGRPASRRAPPVGVKLMKL